MTKKFNELIAVDLFAGAGGVSTGTLQAAEKLKVPIKLTAVNHWKTAVNSHAINHPQVEHICEDVETLHPRKVVPGGLLHLLAASCECTFHSNARGGGPCNEQSRSQPWQLIRWMTDLDVQMLTMENVSEWQYWGPVYPCTCGTKDMKKHRKGFKCLRPIRERRSEFFNSFVATVRGLGYTVEWRVQNCADFGDPTKRKRLILMARKNGPVIWPVPTYGDEKARAIDNKLLPYKSARNHVIDWSLKGKSIFNRKKPLAQNTIRRIMSGFAKFGGPEAEPFLVMLRGLSESHIKSSASSVDEPIRALTAGGNHVGLATPIILGQQSCASPKTPDEPMPTIATAGAISLTEPVIKPFMIQCNHGTDPKPRGKVGSSTHGLAMPVIVHTTHHGKRPAHSVDSAMPTVTAAHRGELALVDPIIVQTDQTGSNGGCCSTVDVPLKTVVSKQNMGLVQPFVCKYYGTGAAVGVDNPLDTVTTKDRFLLVDPVTDEVLGELDILFRMFQPHELAAAHSFPKNYVFTGNKGDQTKQIGNSVPVELAEAHASMAIRSVINV